MQIRPVTPTKEGEAAQFQVTFPGPNGEAQHKIVDLDTANMLQMAVEFGRVKSQNDMRRALGLTF
jgi:hypothetical protein